MNEPLDDDDCRASWSDPIHDEIKKLTGDNRALRMILKDCKYELTNYKYHLTNPVNAHHWAEVDSIIKQIDDELKSE